MKQGDLSESVAKAIGLQEKRLDAIAEALGLQKKPVGLALGRLVMAGLVERLERGVYRLTDEGRARLASGERFMRPGPRGGLTGARRPKTRASFQQRAWNAMRILGQFTVQDVVKRARRIGDKDPTNNLHRYFKALEKAGYIKAARRVAPDSPTSNGLIVWRLEQNTGDVAPAVHRDRHSVFDHNTRERTSWK